MVSEINWGNRRLPGQGGTGVENVAFPANTNPGLHAYYLVRYLRQVTISLGLLLCLTKVLCTSQGRCAQNLANDRKEINTVPSSP